MNTRLQQSCSLIVADNNSVVVSDSLRKQFFSVFLCICQVYLCSVSVFTRLENQCMIRLRNKWAFWSRAEHQAGKQTAMVATPKHQFSYFFQICYLGTSPAATLLCSQPWSKRRNKSTTSTPAMSPSIFTSGYSSKVDAGLFYKYRVHI